MIKRLFRSHQYKIILGAPIIFLVLINSSGTLGAGNIFFLSTEHKNFSSVGEEIPVTVEIYTKSPINAIGGTLTFSPEILSVINISRISSIVDLWSEEPSYANDEGVLHFSGGLVGEKTEKPIDGTVLVATYKVLKEGKAVIAIKDGQLLAHNGEGTNIISGGNVLTLYVRSQGKASPDVNGDGVLSISDANILYLKTFSSYNPKYDLNGDGKVSWADVRLLLSLF